MSEKKSEETFKTYEQFSESRIKEASFSEADQMADELQEKGVTITVKVNGEEKTMEPAELFDKFVANMFDPSVQPIPDDIEAEKLSAKSMDGSTTISFVGGSEDAVGALYDKVRDFWVKLVKAASAP